MARSDSHYAAIFATKWFSLRGDIRFVNKQPNGRFSRTKCAVDAIDLFFDIFVSDFLRSSFTVVLSSSDMPNSSNIGWYLV